MIQKTIKDGACKKTIKRYKNGDFWIHRHFDNGLARHTSILKEEFEAMRELNDEEQDNGE